LNPIEPIEQAQEIDRLRLLPSMDKNMKRQAGNNNAPARTTTIIPASTRPVKRLAHGHKVPERLGRGTRIVERGTLLEKGFYTVGTKLIHVPGTRTHTVAEFVNFKA
jgi:hypothetical protein